MSGGAYASELPALPMKNDPKFRRDLEDLARRAEERLSAVVDTVKVLRSDPELTWSLLEAASTAQVAALRAHAAHGALCWVQHPERLIACDRAVGHSGAHSWESAEVVRLAREFIAVWSRLSPVSSVEERQRVLDVLAEAVNGMEVDRG